MDQLTTRWIRALETWKFKISFKLYTICAEIHSEYRVQVQLIIESLKTERFIAIKENELNKAIEGKKIELKNIQSKGPGAVSKFLNIFGSKSEKEKNLEIEWKKVLRLKLIIIRFGDLIRNSFYRENKF